VVTATDTDHMMIITYLSLITTRAAVFRGQWVRVRGHTFDRQRQQAVAWDEWQSEGRMRLKTVWISPLFSELAHPTLGPKRVFQKLKKKKNQF